MKGNSDGDSRSSGKGECKVPEEKEGEERAGERRCERKEGENVFRVVCSSSTFSSSSILYGHDSSTAYPNT